MKQAGSYRPAFVVVNASDDADGTVMEVIRKRIGELETGDVVDLEGDRYVDPDRDLLYANLYFEVSATEAFDDGVWVLFEGLGPKHLPSDHEVPVVRYGELDWLDHKDPAVL